MLGKKNIFPPPPEKVKEFIDMAVWLIDEGICTQSDLQNLMYFSSEIVFAEQRRLERGIMQDYGKAYTHKSDKGEMP